MQRTVLGIGVGKRHRLLELDTEPRRGGRDHVAFLPADGILQKLRVNAAPLLNAFENKEVRRACRDLDVGGPHDRTAIKMRSDLRVVHFRQCRHLFRLEQAADPAQVHLYDVRRAGRQHAGEFVLGGEPLAGGDGNGGAARHDGHLFRHLGGHGFLEPQWIVGLELPRQANCSRGGELAVSTDQKIGAPSDGLAHQPYQADGALERLLRGLTRIVCGEAAGGVEFQAGEALLDVFGGALGRSIRIVIELVALAGGGIGIQIGVAAQTLVYLAAHEIVDRLLDRLPNDVPAGHLQTADDPHQGQVGAQAESRAIALAPQRFDLKGVAPGEAPREQVLDHLGQHLRAEGGGIDLADPLDAAGGLQFQEYEVAAAEVRRRIVHQKYFDTVELHGPSLPRNQVFKIRSAAFCATMTVGALVLADVTVGNTDASTTRRHSTPCTRSAASTTDSPGALPMRQVPTGWYTVLARARKSATRSDGPITPKSGAMASRINS